MKASNGDLFAFDQILGTSAFIQEALGQGGDSIVDLVQLAGRYAGSWTLPVCDASTWGKAWNWDYATEAKLADDKRTHPPCLCGRSSQFIGTLKITC